MITVKPNARQEGVTTLPDGSLRVAVNAPPIEGRANDRVIAILAKHFHVPKSRITLVRGAREKQKYLEVST